MATTQNTFNGNGSNLGPFSFTFKWLESTDIKVSVGGVLKTAGTHYNLQGLNYTTKTGGQVLFTAGNAPPVGTNNIRIYRDTDDEVLSAVFSSGSAIRAKDLNDNFTQNLYVTQEINSNALNVDGSNAMVGPLNMNGFQIDNLAEPTTDSDAATKKYIDDRYGNLGIPGHTRWRKVATASQTTFSGTGDYGGVLAYSPTREQVYINGALQQRGVDYAADNGTSVVFTVGLTVGDVVDIICVNNLTNSAVSNAGNITYSGQFTGQIARTVAAKLADVVSVKDFGAVGDGVADDTAAIQAALDLGKPVHLPNGKYRVTSELVWSDGTVLIGTTAIVATQLVGNVPLLGSVPEIYYDGPGGTNSCVCRMSKVAVGTKPVYTANESQSLRFAGIYGVYINGNSKAEFGLYSARAGGGCTYQNIGITKTVKHGAWFGELFLSNINNLYADHNLGCGVTIGQNTFSWSGGNNVNGVIILNISANRNGTGLVSWTPADYQLGYGVGLYLGRSCSVNLLDAERNQGVGVVIEPSAGPSNYRDIYVENNCYQFPTSSERYQVWYKTGLNDFSNKVKGIYGLFNEIAPSGATNAPRIKFTGTAASPLVPESVPILQQISGKFVIEADLGSYRIESLSVPSQIIFVSHYPRYSDPESISTSQTTLYVDDSATGDGSGKDASNCITFDDAIAVARVVSSISTVDVSLLTGTPTTFRTANGTGFTRSVTFAGATTGRFAAGSSDSIAIKFSNWAAPLTVKDMSVVDRCYVDNSNVVFRDCSIIRTGANSLAQAAVNVNNSRVEIAGSSVINVSNSTAATKIGITVSGSSTVSFSSAAAGTIVSYTAGNAINFSSGGGLVLVSATTATATWAAAANVARDTGGGGGMILAPNGLNP